MHVIHNGVRAPSAPPSRSREPESPRLACIARLSPQKDVPLLLDALAQSGNESWEVDIFGAGPDWWSVERRIHALGLERRVHLLGDIDGAARLLPQYDAFALPSNWEGLPFSVLEAMAAGLPVIASDVGGVAEAVVHERTGLLVPRGDTSRFAEALRRIVADPTWARSLGVAGHAHVKSAFGLDTMLARYDALFASVLGKGSYSHDDVSEAAA
jgi:glycosyltransferase involved in cell wall biosynthesis